ncbi:B3/4 domain-containing protein [Alkalihalobacillus sp. AL-G]|uniref:B3/B4 domain-containing protein n=1 Tax=Alkalihalobacillus sp. AL-G TaxID=2926399 RepID=UPI00272ADDA4|nr:phenylalanine--tRNA ligase beta subunit-related protein [Alkalihalobacillus sp. AL-G]WLD94004.1 hypothetical protein MOJ78_03645 [Alkalihalobacillus sp. AL-G]
MTITISNQMQNLSPDFKIGVIQYHNITVEDSPKMLAGRLQLYQESLMLEADEKPISSIEPIQEWRQLFKKAGTDPSRYRPSSEALLRRVYKGQQLGPIHSAADTNNFFSLQYKLPLGIYDLAHLKGDVAIDIGSEEDHYEAINGRNTDMKGKVLSRDATGAFGSPIIDSKRTMVTEDTKDALHLVYFQPSLTEENAAEMLDAIQKMFIQIHGGSATTEVVVAN